MKKYIFIINLIFLTNSCDIVEGPYMTDADSYVNPEKKVLIEDFTGHRCTGCPTATKEISAIQDVYGNQVIAIAIHPTGAESFTHPHPPHIEGFQYDWRTSWGDNWDETFQASAPGLPKGMVNRIGDQSKILDSGEWAAVVADELKKEVDYKINITSDANSVTMSTEIKNDINGNFKYVVCLTESNIINWQKDGTLNIEDYEHNNVLRTVLADEELSSTTNYSAGQIIEKTITYDLISLEQLNIDYSFQNEQYGNGNAGGWNASNMSVVAYIYNDITKEIMQVEEVNLNN